MDVTPNSPVASQNSFGAGVSNASTDGGSALSSDFETFIKMLTVQMENQDPLNPIESADFATQLATFSGVEQQVLTNDLLQQLGGQFGAFGVSQLSGWIGMEGRAIAPVNYDGGPINLTISGTSIGDAHQLVVRDVAGQEVQRTDVSGQSQDIVWDAVGSDGSGLPPGVYQVSVESFSQGDLIGVTPAQVHGRIVEARLQGTETILVLENGQEVSSSAIIGLRESETS